MNLNNFGFGGNNGWLWILIILLIICNCGGMIEGIFDKLTNCDCLIPLLVVWLCCCNKGGSLGFGCGCGK